MMEARESLSEKVVKLAQKYRDLQKAYNEALERIRRLEDENADLKDKLERAMKELKEIDRTISSLLEE